MLLIFKNILITSVGAKRGLIESVLDAAKKFKNMKVFGVDASSTALGQYFVDQFWQIPKRDEIDLKFILNFCKQRDIAYIIPTSDGDVAFFGKLKDELVKEGIHTFCAPFESIKICNDKLAFSKKAVNAVFTSLNIDEVDATSYVVKERFGSGSKKVLLNASYNEAKEFAKELLEPVFQPFIKAKEYSVDTYMTQKQEVVDAIVRERSLVIDGESKITTYCADEKIEQMTKSLVKEFNLIGHSVVQVLKTKEKLYFLECNARFGGASTLSYKIGLESFYWFLCECEDRSFEYKKNLSFKKQVRVEKDFYFEN